MERENWNMEEQFAQIFNMVIVKCQWCDHHPKIGSIMIDQSARGTAGMICDVCALNTRIIFEPGYVPKQVRGEGCKLC